jgi:GH15 family glucan-1,4-alpha-glucosidase
MTRHFVLGNGHIHVGLDYFGRVRDFFFPYIGQENHVNGKIHRLGVWVDGEFSWIEADHWQRKIGYKQDTLVTDITASWRGITLHFNDCVLHDKNVFLRKVTVKNNTEYKKEVRVFFHGQYEISEGNVGDTVYYNPIVKSVIHYKGKRYFLMNGSVGNKGITQFATGLVGEYGREGTWKDAEDGVLGGNTIEHGSVDSVVSFTVTVAAKKQQDVYFWVAVGICHHDVASLNNHVVTKTPEALLEKTELHWRKWANKTKFKFMNLKPEVVHLFKRSLLTIRTQVDNGGAIIASTDSDMLHLRKDTYSYSWPRDGALIARSLDRAGYSGITTHFFNFSQKGLSKDGYLFHKYRPDGSLGSSWHSWLYHDHIQLPIQEDETALVLDALWKHYEQHGDKASAKAMFSSFVQPAAEFMVKYMDKKTGLLKESYDLWEEKLGIHTFTCATVFAGFNAAANFEEIFGTKARAKIYRKKAEQVKQAILNYLYDEKLGYFIKMVYYNEENGKKKILQDTTLDISSTYGVFQFGVLPPTDRRVKKSIHLCKERLQLKTNSGGVARYENDYYYRIDQEGTPGNPWFITTLWLAEYYIAIAKTQNDLQPAIDIFNWVASHTLETGVLSEQLHPHNGSPVSVAPLTWSHAGFVIAINKYLEKLDELGICKMCNPPKVKQ